MTRIVPFAIVAAAALALSGCGKSDSAKEAAQADNVEMPAEEAVNSLDEGATPAAETSDMASDMAMPTDTAAATPAPTKAAEKK